MPIQTSSSSLLKYLKERAKSPTHTFSHFFRQVEFKDEQLTTLRQLLCSREPNQCIFALVGLRKLLDTRLDLLSLEEKQAIANTAARVALELSGDLEEHIELLIESLLLLFGLGMKGLCDYSPLANAKTLKAVSSILQMHDDRDGGQISALLHDMAKTCLKSRLVAQAFIENSILLKLAQRASQVLSCKSCCAQTIAAVARELLPVQINEHGPCFQVMCEEMMGQPDQQLFQNLCSGLIPFCGGVTFLKQIQELKLPSIILRKLRKCKLSKSKARALLLLRRLVICSARIAKQLVENGFLGVLEILAKYFKGKQLRLVHRTVLSLSQQENIRGSLVQEGYLLVNTYSYWLKAGEAQAIRRLQKVVVRQPRTRQILSFFVRKRLMRATDLAGRLPNTAYFHLVVVLATKTEHFRRMSRKEGLQLLRSWQSYCQSYY